MGERMLIKNIIYKNENNMRLISHRGNINGRVESSENKPSYIDLAIDSEYDVEIDVWYIDDQLYLGHDEAQYTVDFRWFRDRIRKLWIHCKNIEALLYFREVGYDFNYFYHNEDDVTLTSKNHLWTYPGKKLTNQSIAVMPENVPDWDISNCMGICSDYIKNHKTY
jgi:hypothetical protein